MADKAGEKTAPGRLGSDVTAGKIIGVAGGLLIVIGIVLATVLGLTDYFTSRRRPPAVVTETAQVPPSPRLQSRPAADLQTLRQQKQALLGSYGWVDKKAGIVHIPIERAMELLAERTSPPRQDSTP